MAKIYPQAYLKDSIVPLGAANLSVASSAVLFGLSVYTVFLATSTEEGMGVFSLDKHYDRLVNSTRIIGIDSFEKEWTRERFTKVVAEIIQANAPTENVLIRTTVHVADLLPGALTKGLGIALSMFMYEAKPLLPQDGARLKTSIWRRNPDVSIPARAKVNGAYVNSVLAKQDAKDSGYDDAIFLDVAGHVSELSAANIFLVRGGVLIAPDKANDILEGITRATIFNMAHEFNIPVQERTVDLSELYIADEVFACGTSAFVASVKEIDGRIIGSGTTGPITKKIQEKYRAVISGKDEKYLSQLTFF